MMNRLFELIVYTLGAGLFLSAPEKKGLTNGHNQGPSAEGNAKERSQGGLMKIELEQYKILANRRQAQDTLIWQTPALSLTAQAFLLTIVFRPDSSAFARCLAACLSLLTALASLQLIIKHRYFEKQDSLSLETFEEAHQNEGYRIIHQRRSCSSKWYLRLKSYNVWVFTLWVFVAIALSSGVIAIVRPSFFFAPVTEEAKEVKVRVQDISNESMRLRAEVASLRQQLNDLSQSTTNHGKNAKGQRTGPRNDAKTERQIQPN
jgi:hypothetical protein